MVLEPVDLPLGHEPRDPVVIYGQAGNALPQAGEKSISISRALNTGLRKITLFRFTSEPPTNLLSNCCFLRPVHLLEPFTIKAHLTSYICEAFHHRLTCLISNTSRWTRELTFSANTPVEVSLYTSFHVLCIFRVLTSLFVFTSHQKVVLEIDFSGSLWVFRPLQSRPSFFY
jgi:hypothetical protein